MRENKLKLKWLTVGLFIGLFFSGAYLYTYKPLDRDRYVYGCAKLGTDASVCAQQWDDWWSQRP